MGEFAKNTEAKYQDGYIRFNWKNESEQRVFEISSEALMEAFGASGSTANELLEAFERGRSRIAQAVERSLNTPTDGVTELGSGDFVQDAQQTRSSSH